MHSIIQNLEVKIYVA